MLKLNRHGRNLNDDYYELLKIILESGHPEESETSHYTEWGFALSQKS